ncbi:metallophosphoesterase [Primorskyibacter sp. S187A]|uniref:metallophosphoesterase n=1 Tax=Primorskyibacter sp. S187A TaxID=3415130 RepID=UPI003C7A9184
MGDIHGRLDLLDALLERLQKTTDAPHTRLVVVGDMVDRGPDAAGVLALLHDRMSRPAPFAQTICLMGNHERMMLDFLSDPVTHGPRWLSNGGAETLHSFDLSPERFGQGDADARLRALGQAMREALGPVRLDWLSQLPLFWQEGTLAVTHAAALPGRAMADQPPEVLLWGHPAFLRGRRKDGLWVAHGHTIVAEAAAEQGRISVDTGAWRTGCLSAAVIDEEGIRFESVVAHK